MECVRYEQNVFDNLERVVAAVARAAVDEYRAAIDLALASNVQLANLGPEYHPEVIVRRFLAAIRERLVALAPDRDPLTFN